jgi:hypothetical protein
MRKRFSDHIITALGFLGVALVIGFILWAEYGLWQECLVDHSFFYCWRTIG